MATHFFPQPFPQLRPCPKHPSYKRELVCLKKQCIYNSLICSQCVKISHNDPSHFVQYLHIFLKDELTILSCNAEGNPQFYQALLYARNKVSEKQTNFLQNLTNFISPLLSKIRFAANNQLGNHFRSFDPECYQKELLCLSSSGFKDQKIINACYKTQILRKNEFNQDPKLVEQAANKYLQLFEQFQIFLHNWRNKVLQHQYVADLRFSQSNPKQKMNGVRIFQKQNIKQPSQGRIEMINQQKKEKITINLESDEEEGEITDERSRQKDKGVVERNNSGMNSNEKRNRKTEKKVDRELQEQRKSESKNEKKQWKRMDASHIYFPMKDESGTNLDKQQKNPNRTNPDNIKQTIQPFIITPIQNKSAGLHHFPIKQNKNNPSQPTNKNIENKQKTASKAQKSTPQNNNNPFPQIIINKSSKSKRESQDNNQTIKISMKGDIDVKQSQSMGIVFRMKDGSVKSCAQAKYGENCRNQKYQSNLDKVQQESKVKVASQAVFKQKQKIISERISPSVQNMKNESGQDPRRRQDQTSQQPQQQQPQQPQQRTQQQQYKQPQQQLPPQPQQQPPQQQPPQQQPPQQQPPQQQPPQQQPPQQQQPQQQQPQQQQQPPQQQPLIQAPPAQACVVGKNFRLINGKKRPCKKPSHMSQQQIKDWFNKTYKDEVQESIVLSHRPGSQTNFLWYYQGLFLWKTRDYFKQIDEFPKVQDYWQSLSSYR